MAGIEHFWHLDLSRGKMAKRFTDTDKWKKPFFRGLDAPYKALWLYILDDCDIAGIWIVDFEIARIRVGDVTELQALEKFGDHVKAFDNGRKWFIRDFTDFQYGELKESNRMHQAVIKILQSNKLQGASEGLPSPQGQGQGNRQGKGYGQGQESPSSFIENFANAFDEIWLEQACAMKFPQLDITEELSHFRNKCDSAPMEYHYRDRDGLRLGFLKQLKGAKVNTKKRIKLI